MSRQEAMVRKLSALVRPLFAQPNSHTQRPLVNLGSLQQGLQKAGWGSRGNPSPLAACESHLQMAEGGGDWFSAASGWTLRTGPGSYREVAFHSQEENLLTIKAANDSTVIL